MEKKIEDYLGFIKSRKSVRDFIFEKIEKEKINEILECGRWAPSGLNNQPWKVNVVNHPTIKRMVAENIKYSAIVEGAYYNLVIFLDKKKGYNRVKDIQSIGAFIENILLGAHALNLGAVWIGEILNKKEKMNEIFKLKEEDYELMGVVAIGVEEKTKKNSGTDERKRETVENFTEWY